MTGGKGGEMGGSTDETSSTRADNCWRWVVTLWELSVPVYSACVKGQTEWKWSIIPLGNTYSKMNIINYYLPNHFKILLRLVSTAIHCKRLIK